MISTYKQSLVGMAFDYMREKYEMLVTNIFPFSHKSFYYS